MAAGLPDLVDCARLAEEGVTLHREYEVDGLDRLSELTAEPRGSLSARFVFRKLPSGRPGAEVVIDATPQLVCQRCLQGFGLPVVARSEIEFAISEQSDGANSEREFYMMRHGQVSLRELAEEELLLALPIAPVCSTPSTCGKAPSNVSGAEMPGRTGAMRRPFSDLQNLLKKT